MAELLEDHVSFHVLDPSRKTTSEHELMEIVRSYLK
jgi:hypothetical protein